MTREEALAELSVLHERLSNPKDCEDGCYSWEDGWYVEAIDMAIEALSAVQGWIPCSERLPNVGENVLFTTDIYGGYVAEGDRRADGKWWQYRWNALLQNEEVTAWMPLPTPYKGGD